MKNLGKIVILIVFLGIKAHAEVKAFVDKTTVMQGDTVTLRIEVFGDDVTPPDIDTLCRSEVTGNSSSQSIQIINANITKNYTFVYTFEPQKSCDIMPIPIEVDGKIERTQKIHINVSDTPPQSRDSSFVLELKTDKTEVFVGETFRVSLFFKQKKGAEAIDSKFYPPKLDGFWIKHQSEPKKYTKGEYFVTQIDYIMAAQREGELTITPAKIKIAVRDLTRDYWNNFAPSIRWKTYYSNSIRMRVHAPPAGVKLVGNFSIDLRLDKTTVHVNEPLSAVVTIRGEGNIEDLEPFKPYIPNGSVFEEKPQIDQEKGIFRQKLTFVADANFTIPRLSIRFFNPQTKQIKTAATQPIAVTVVGAKTRDLGVVVKKNDSQETAQNTLKSARSGAVVDMRSAITWIILAFFSGAFISATLIFLTLRKSGAKKMRKFSIDDKKTVFVKLLPYKEQPDVKRVLQKLENILYGDGSAALEKNEIKEIVKKYNIQ